ncbi:MAG: TetR family transcriptional regulator [Betaproteobacteria bacterium]|nr:TetR family transcriptional regulator [Betaproteobacteria bacterium]
MCATATPPAAVPRAETRRAQILAAAATCFRRHGFHGASVAAIATASGMSVGHIYHYFENKEAIIAGIVAGDLERFRDLSAQLRSAPDVLDALLGAVADGVQRAVDPDAAALKVEIAAEASRNDRVARIVRTADSQAMAGLADLLAAIRRDNGRDDAVAADLAEIVAALIDGLMLRRIRNPELDAEAAVRMVRRVIRCLVDERAPGSGP